MSTEAMKLALDWYDSGHEDRDEFEAMIKVLLATPQPQQGPVACKDCGAVIKDGVVKCVRGRNCWVGQQTAQPQQEPVADEVRCPECGYLTKHTEHIGCLRNQLNTINAFEQRNFAIVNMDKGPQPAQYRSTGWAAHRDQYAVPVLFNPYTGEPRDVRDVQSDPQGILIVPPGKVEMRPAKQTHHTELRRLHAIEDAARNLVKVKGRYNTEQAYNKLKELLT